MRGGRQIPYLAGRGEDRERMREDLRGYVSDDGPSGRKERHRLIGWNGVGRRGFRESTMVVEMLEELLEAGFGVKTAVQMMNTALVIGREEVRFSTIDVSLF